MYAYAEQVADSVPDAFLGQPATTYCNACGARGPRMKRCATCRHAYYCDAKCQEDDWKRDHLRPRPAHRKVCDQLRKLTLRAEKAGFDPALDKMMCAECDFGPCDPDMLRWHCTLMQHRRWPEKDLLMYETPSPTE